MKILQVIQKPQFRGAETFACQLSVELKNLGHEVDVLFLFGTDDEKLPYPLHFIHLNASIERRFWDFKAYQKLNTIITKGNYDVVQANAADTLKYTVFSKFIHGWQSKLVYRNANKISDFMTTFSKKALNKLLMKKVDAVASVSHECLQDFITVYPSFSKTIECLPIGVNLEIPTSYSSLTEIGITSGGPFLLNVASFVPEKNHEGLLRIFSKLLVDYPSAQLLLIGEGKLKSSIETLAEELNLNNNLHFLGKRNDVLKIMPCCDMFLLPSLIEGLPGVILEAFATRLPVVAYNVGGIKEVVLDKNTGYLIGKNDEVEFYEAIKQCFSDNKKTLQESAYLLVYNHYSNAILAKRFLKFYQNVII
ncbi:MAG: glycosyltransferase family 4 protein [Flavobacterium sp.]|uniref:glycosyltransferase family 4 protein n=1 Tax=Flavobacterium sp. TaxID=239 RepID=UPI003BEC1892